MSQPNLAAMRAVADLTVACAADAIIPAINNKRNSFMIVFSFLNQRCCQPCEWAPMIQAHCR